MFVPPPDFLLTNEQMGSPDFGLKECIHQLVLMAYVGSHVWSLKLRAVID